MSGARPEGDVWRVDVGGHACFVKGEHAKDHLERANREMARMKMALYRILKMNPDEWGVQGIYKAQALATEGLERERVAR